MKTSASNKIDNNHREKQVLCPTIKSQTIRKALAVLSLGFCLSAFAGCGAPVADHAAMSSMVTVPALAEVSSGIYVVARNDAQAGTSTGEDNNVLLTQDRRIYVRAAGDYGTAAELAAAKLKAHRNNIYEMAVNTTGISHATVAVRRGGRVLLQTHLPVGDESTVIATRGSGTDNSQGTDKSSQPRLARGN